MNSTNTTTTNSYTGIKAKINKQAIVLNIPPQIVLFLPKNLISIKIPEIKYKIDSTTNKSI